MIKRLLIRFTRWLVGDNELISLVKPGHEAALGDLKSSTKKMDDLVAELEGLIPDTRKLMVDISDYAPMDRYRDFVRVFGAPDGKRVLSQILIWGRMNKSTFSPDPYVMALMTGERNLALKIVAGLTQPVELPTERRKA